MKTSCKRTPQSQRLSISAKSFAIQETTEWGTWYCTKWYLYLQSSLKFQHRRSQPSLQESQITTATAATAATAATVTNYCYSEIETIIGSEANTKYSNNTVAATTPQQQTDAWESKRRLGVRTVCRLHVFPTKTERKSWDKKIFIVPSGTRSKDRQFHSLLTPTQSDAWFGNTTLHWWQLGGWCAVTQVHRIVDDAISSAAEVVGNLQQRLAQLHNFQRSCSVFDYLLKVHTMWSSGCSSVVVVVVNYVEVVVVLVIVPIGLYCF